MKLNVEAHRWMEDTSGAWLCIKTKHARSVCCALDLHKQYDCEITEHREKRSLNANAYAWVLLDKLAAQSGIPKTQIYREAIREIGGNTETVCVVSEAVEKLCEGWRHNGLGWLTDTLPSKIPGCTNVVLYYGSSTFDTKQMARFIDGLVQDCQSLGIETMPPDKLHALLEAWK